MERQNPAQVPNNMSYKQLYTLNETRLQRFCYKQVGTSCMGTDFYNTKTECHFLTRKCERLFLVNNYNNSTVQQKLRARKLYR